MQPLVALSFVVALVVAQNSFTAGVDFGVPINGELHQLAFAK